MTAGEISYYCTLFIPRLEHFFDFSFAPSLLLYAYVPISVAALMLGVYLLIQDKRSVRSILFFSIVVVFCLNILNEVFQWVLVPAAANLFAWKISALLQILVFLCTYYFTYYFIEKRFPPFIANAFAFALFLPVLFMLPTSYNMARFDTINCEGVNGYGWLYVYFLEMGAVFALGILLIKKVRAGVSNTMKRQNLSIILSSILFLLVLAVVNIFGDLLGEYIIYLAVSISMAIFIVFVTYSIVTLRTFNVGLLASQALVLALIVLIGSEFFFVHTDINRILIAFTLVLTGAIGIVLIRSVKKEIELRKHVQSLAKDLENSNKQQIILIHFITHQIKGFVAKSRNIFATILDGDYGQVQDTVRPMLEEGLRSDTKGVATIQEILNAANIKSGKVSYAKESFDVKALVDEVVADHQAAVAAKGLLLTTATGSEPLMFAGDRAQLVNAFKNLVDNSIKYTPKGEVHISLAKEAGKIRFTVQDTGVGISKEDMANLFTEGGHGKNSVSINVESTGFGLYIVKNIIEAHNGKVWAESEGAGKGARFITELPV
jgi:signal transduction histidine kinase